MRIFIISNLILMTKRKPSVNNLVLGQMSPGGSEQDLSSQELAAQWWEVEGLRQLRQNSIGSHTAFVF